MHVELCIHALTDHVHGQRYDIDVAGALPVAKQRAFDALGAGHEPEFGGGHTGAAVVVGVKRQNKTIAAREVAVHPLNLVGVHIGRSDLHGRWQVDDGLVGGRRLPHVHDGLADLQRIGQLGLRKAFGRILAEDTRAGHLRFRQFLYEPGAGHRDLRNSRLLQPEDDAALRR